MRSLFLDAVFGQHKNLLGILDRGKAVCNDKGCSAFGQMIYCLLYMVLGDVIQGRGR